VAIVDVDRFKSVNDRWGHPAGDRVLAAVSQRVAGALRASDMLARWGGEEFAVLLTELPAEDAPAAAAAALERARVAVSARPVALPGAAQAPTVSVSAGFVVFAGGPGTGEDLLRRADEALYAAKNGGRNRVVSA
jgi:diguanylate cyclase (GGDEF)-like protein